ncbi:UNVERIFIED_CONTAM: hypothetical protein RMT77_001014 [Armadillidium vulgare]
MAVSDILVLLRNDIEKSIPGNSSFKIKVTAIDICGPYIVLGSNAGTLYLFNNETSSFIQKIQTTKGRITQISISPDIAFLACSSSSGLVFILKIPNFVPQSNLHPVSSRKHEGSIVTALSWSNNGRDLYIGDGNGILSLLHVPPNLASSLILNLTHYLMKMDSAIYQIHTHSHYLLVSTLTKSYICNTRLETFSVVGTKPRHGEYGGCIARVLPNGKFSSSLTESMELNQKVYPGENYSGDNTIEKAVEVLPDYYNENTENMDQNRFKSVNRKISNEFHKFIKEDLFLPNDNDKGFQKDHYRLFCARPGFRIWESNFMGSVIATHQLKNAVPEHQPLVILCNDDFYDFDASERDRLTGNSFSFKKIYRFYNDYLLANSTSAFYIIEPSNSKIILWCSVHEGIQEIRAFDNSILILTLDSKVLRYLITTVDLAILTLHSNALFLQCANVCLKYASIFEDSYLLRHCWQSILNVIISNVKDPTIVRSVIGLKEKISFLKSEVSLKKFGNENICNKFGFEKVEGNINILERNFQSTDHSYPSRLNGGKIDKQGNISLDVVHNISSSDNLQQSIPLSVHEIDSHLITGFEESTLSKEEYNNFGLSKSTFQNISPGNLSNEASPCLDNLKSSQSLDQCAVVGVDLTPSNINNCVLKPYLELEEVVVGVRNFLKHNPSKLVKKALLVLFLKYYLAANLAKSQTDDDNGNSYEYNYEQESSFTYMIKNELVAEVSSLILLCFEEKVVLSCHYKDSLKFKRDIRSHSLTTEIFKDIDKFYSYLISEDKGLICHKMLMNNLYSVENHLGLMCCTWFSIMAKVTSKYEEGLELQILPNIDFDRSQRTQYLRHFLDAKGWNSFMAAISQIHHHTALYEIYYFLGYFLLTKKDNCASIDIYQCLHEYFDNISCDIIKENYSKYWSSCCELQNDIITSLLYKWDVGESVCSCKYPLPNCLANKSKFCDLIKTMINCLPLYDPQKIYTLFRERYFYSGVFDIVFRYNVKPLPEMVPYILQSFQSESILYLLGELDVSFYPYLMKILVKMYSGDDISVKCLNCLKQLSVCPTTAATSNKPRPKNSRDSSVDYFELKTYSSLWELIYKNIINIIGIQKSIQMLQDIDEEIPSLVPLKRLIIKDAFSLLSQSSNVMVMDDFSNNQDFPKLQFSKDVFSKIDEIVQQATAVSKEEAYQMFYFREKKNCSKKYIDVGDDASKEITEGLSGPKNSNLQWESSLSTDLFQPNELIEKFDRNLSRKNYHWGVKARILNGVCYLCHLGLAIDVMVKAGGLTVFPCGHAYHNVCLAQYDKFCFICLRSRSK